MQLSTSLTIIHKINKVANDYYIYDKCNLL